MKKGEFNPHGLSSKEAEQRLLKYGENVLKSKNRIKPYKILFSQFKDALVLILLAATFLSILMGEISEAITIIIIVLVNSILGFIQEFKTEKTLDALKSMAAPVCRVIRDNIPAVIPAKNIVCGDVVILDSGDRVPADCIIIEANSLFADESLLTGESVPVEKYVFQGDISDNIKSEPNRNDMAYMGTLITKGNANAIVISTGMDTQMGQIAGLLNEIQEEATPLQKRLGQLGKLIGIGCLIICAVVSVVGILRGENILDMIITGISLSVAAVPEGLPAIVTISLALAVNHMLKRKALIKNLHAVETLGCASVICSDKTGTLTENKMTVKKIFCYQNEFSVSGDGLVAGGEFKINDSRIVPSRFPDLKKALEISVLCNDSMIYTESGKNPFSRNRALNLSTETWSASGDPTEIALLVCGGKAQITKESLESEYTKHSEIPFDSERKCMSVLHYSRSDQKILVTKGAPDILLKKCSQVLCGDKIIAKDNFINNEILKKNDEYASEALRVIAVAYRNFDKTTADVNDENSLIFVGLFGMIDPPRKEAFEAVRKCRRAGIRPIMITGDHKITAKAIASRLKIYNDGDIIITGDELNTMSDDHLSSVINKVSVFARVNPNHKLRIVRAFKQKGHIVAMTGDGVNDAPAIKEADIGVSMGISGTDVTKEAAQVILLDDNFATLVAAVEEGRVIYSNIRKFIRYLLSCNIGEVLTMFVGMMMGMPVILFPIQILLVNLVTDGLPAICLGLEPPQNDEMTRRPRKKDESVFSNGLLHIIIFRGCLIGLTTLGVFVSLFKLYDCESVARTGAFLALVLVQLIHVFECKSETLSLLRIPVFNNKRLIMAVLISAVIIFMVIYCPTFQLLFKTVSLSLGQLLVVFLYILAVPLISSLIKFRKKK